MPKTRVAVFYGGQSTEHEISIITALQVMHALKDADYTVLPIYIAKSGDWFLGNDKFIDPGFYRNLNHPATLGKPVTLNPNSSSNPSLSLKSGLIARSPVQFDVAFPVFHGRYGEDGTLQGLLQFLNIPYAGASLTAATVGINKHLSKLLAKELGFPTVPGVLISQRDWSSDKTQFIDRLHALGPVWIVKPNQLGSSIGVRKSTSDQTLSDAIEVALVYDSQVLVEQALTDFMEVNLSILGNDPYELSVTEQPITQGELLSYDDKYKRGGSKKVPTTDKGMASASRIMPAPVSDEILNSMHQFACDYFKLIGGRGLSRIDFFVKDGQAIFNEINTIPGSMAYYLWEKSGLPFPKLVDKLVKLGLENFKLESQLVKTFDSNVLENFKLPGSKR